MHYIYDINHLLLGLHELLTNYFTDIINKEYYSLFSLTPGYEALPSTDRHSCCEGVYTARCDGTRHSLFTSILTFHRR